MNTIRRFISDNRVRAVVDWADANPNVEQDEWARHATHYRVTLKCGRRQMTTPWSQGSAITREPSAADVLDCLASDAVGIENASSFEEWCAEYGYDSDSRKAERIFQTCTRQSADLKALVGEDAYRTLLWDTERL